MNILKLITKEISDPYVQENFDRLNRYFRDLRNLLGFQHFVIEVTEAGDNLKFPHNLGFQPKDVVLTSQIGDAVIQFNYALFDKTNLDLSVVSGTPTRSNPTVIRAYIGTHLEGDL